ncbi:MAG: TonB-dependent receptor [Acidobacteriota bacterium]|nr:TonB-dependent receptor [Acidobacteriota bacterium]
MRLRINPQLVVAACLATLLLAGTAPRASAQTVTGTIFGKVVDADGLPMPGATVNISSKQLIGGTQSRVTGNDGEYRFPALPPGSYSIQVSMPGFAAYSREGIVLGAGASLGVDPRLELASVKETVTVSGGSPMVDVKNSQVRETATQDFLENVPTGRTFVDVFNMMPGVVSGGYNIATTGTNSVHGGSVRNNVFSLDGVNVNDPLVAYPGTDVNIETIEEVQVTTAGMSAEFGSASGAVFNVITKSGSNNLSGQVNGYFRDKSMQADNVTDDLRARGIRQGTRLSRAADWGGSLGGPMLRDRLWYFANFQRIDETRRAINISPDIVADQSTYFGKVTTQLTQRNRLDGFYQYRLRYDFPFIPSVNEQDPAVWRRHRQNNHTMNVKWTSTLTDRTFVEARGSIANQRRFTSFPNAGEEDYGYQDTSTGLISGGWYRELARPGHRNSRTVKADLTHFADGGVGTHELKGGVSYDLLINDEYREWLAGARRHILFNNRPDRIQLSNAPVDQKGRLNQLAMYVQDQWSATTRLTINAGLRFESIEGWYPEGANGGVNFPKVEYPEQRDVLNFRNLAPRLGVTYDPFGSRRTVVKGTFGRYYNQVYTSEFDAAVPFAFGSKIYQWNDQNGDRVWQPGEEGTLISDSTVPALGRLDPNVKQSYVDSGTLGIEHEFGANIAMGVSFIVKREQNMAETLNASAPFDEGYQPVSLVNPVSGQPITIYPLRVAFRGLPTERLYTNPGRSTCSFCPELERKYRAVEFSMRRRMKDGWQLFGSYVYGRSEGNKGTGHTESQGDVFANPNNLVNAFGRLTLDRPHQVKVQGTYELPYGIALSGSYSGLSGTPWARQIRFVRADTPAMVVESQIVVRAEPLGAQRLDFVHDTSVRVEKRFSLGRERTLGVIADVFNLFNASTVTSLQQTRVDLAAFGKPGEIVLPRTLRLGARFTF